MEAGLSAAVHITGVSVADYDNDGDLDLYTVAASQHEEGSPDTYNRLFRNDGDGTFTDVTRLAGVEARTSGYPNRYMGNRFGASWADFDSDGDPDLLITQIGPEILYQNNGDGTFTDVSDASGINVGAPPSDTTETVGATWFDYNRDGRLDVYLDNWNGPNRMYRNVGGQFEEVGMALGVADTSRTWTMMPLDANHDGWPDLYLANDFGPNALYLNQQGQAFVDATFEYQVGDEGHGMGLAVGDINGDLLLDLYVTNIAQTIYQNVLFVGVATPPYEEVASFLGVEDAGWGWGTEFFDADLDGDVDLYAVNGFVLENGTQNQYWSNRLVPDGRVSFANETAASGAGDTAEARGVVVFDYDEDGDLDMVVAAWGDRLRLFENQSQGRHWLKLNLRGSVSNLDALGARVEVETADGRQVRLNDGVDIFGQSIAPVHFGLGLRNQADVTVYWPSGLVETWGGLRGDTSHTLVEGGTWANAADLPATQSLELYPNPVAGVVTVEGLLGVRGPLVVYDALGRVARVSELSGEAQAQVNVSGLRPGLYAIRVGTQQTVFLKR